MNRMAIAPGVVIAASNAPSKVPTRKDLNAWRNTVDSAAEPIKPCAQSSHWRVTVWAKSSAIQDAAKGGTDPFAGAQRAPNFRERKNDRQDANLDTGALA